MQIPLEWLKQYVNVEAAAEEVGTRLSMGGLELEGIETERKPERPLVPVLDVYVTPNRGDCLSMVGVAREVSALYELPLRVPAPAPSESGGATGQQTSVTIEDTELCPRYVARLVRSIKIGPSPQWMQERLLSAGQRPINNVVDVTNYVMLELGQPLHAFDLKRLAGERIVVRRAREDEKLITLDGVERALTPDMLVIADAEKPVAMAGIMGGAESEVSEETTDILLESAHFDPLSVRRTSRALGLRTEASYRFERIVDPEGARRAADRACELLAEIGQPQAVQGCVDIYPSPNTSRLVTLRTHRASQLLGMRITTETAIDCLTRLGFRAHSRVDSDTIDVEVPTFRPDVMQEEDLIEEVGRIYGYENIPETLPIGTTTRGGDSVEGRLITRVKQLLVECGLQEVVTHSLTSPSFFDAADDAMRRVAIRNALSAEVSGLRRSLIPTLLDVAQRNVARGQNALGLFEVGHVYQLEETSEGIAPREYVAVAGLLTGPLTAPDWQQHGKAPVADYAFTRGVVERLLAGLQITRSSCMTPQEIAPPATSGEGEKGRRGEGERGYAAAAERVVPQFHPGRTALLCLAGALPDGVIGELHPRLAAELSLRDRIYLFEIRLDALQRAMPAEGQRFRPLSPYPAVTRDLAPRLAEETPYACVQEAVKAANVPVLEEYRLTDVFSGSPLPEGIKSLTLSFTFRSAAGTLKEAEINAALAAIRTELETRCGATFPA